MKMKIQIGSVTYSRGELQDKLRDIKNQYQPGDDINDPKHIIFLDECHRQGNEINGLQGTAKSWFVHEPQLGYCGTGFGIRQKDDSVDFPSINRLAGKKNPPRAPKAAARHDIADQIREFKGSKAGPGGIFTCEKCGNTGDVSNFEAHHDETLPYSEVWEWFLSELGLTTAEINVVEEHDRDGQIRIGLAEPYATAFRLYHKKRAKLVLLCKDCHAGITYGWGA